MAPPLPILHLLLLLLLLLLSLRLSSSDLLSLRRGSSLSVENPSDVLVSPAGAFSAGFFGVGENAYTFAIWHGGPNCTGPSCVPVWMANRGVPVNGKGSRLSLTDNGNLVLSDAGASTAWSSDTVPSKAARLQLNDTGNLVLAGENGEALWQSFDFPTDTLLPTQVMKRDTVVISSRSRSNYSEGFYSLYFNDDNVLHLIFNGPTFSSSYWPFPWARPQDLGRFVYNSSRSAVLDPLGYFLSSDEYKFYSSDYGVVIPRRLTVDPDGNLRVYSLDTATKNWSVSWEAFSNIPCFIHGVCGNNSLCSYDRTLGRSCSCVPGYERVDPDDWSLGCRPTFELSDSCGSDVGFVKVLYVDFYGYDYDTVPNTTLDNCQKMCAESCSCRGFQYTLSSSDTHDAYDCYLKIELLNGHNLPSFSGEFHLKVNKSVTFTTDQLERRTRYNCTGVQKEVLDRRYPQKGKNGVVNFMLWFAIAVAAIEILVVFVVWFFFFRNQQDITAASHSYFLAATGFQRFTYDELKKATKNFSQEIGRGSGGIVYRGVLPDNRVAAVKLLNEAITGEADFLAEVSTIGKLNHMNLIEMWGYCAEGKHRLLVYEYMEHGSLAENLSSQELDWRRRSDIALGTAKGLAYLHEECLEWVLHCDVKPQNILLDSEYHPKVADFGLSKLMDRGKGTNSDFSRIRGTRGYMAPEWVSNLPITAKVDVYSYGIVMLELVTGMNPATSVHSLEGRGDVKHIRLVTWARQKMQESASNPSGVDEMVDPILEGNYNRKKMEILIQVALQCVAEDKDTRPTMGQVVEMLLRHDNNDL
ncbi:putative receptor protein kinase ZmPK1 [Punica granatum]|uniref:Receptor-like serine/threonine-protein kinase n=1 Tax=Punica granatum TaxID=22663 RepID=A0A218WF52_PUNGR|nr:putative receptor protein kinase ZmPK1 [Punica granatum]OWM70841.1 hypothetical protein CDL15_Pgr014514 [Punica granatum]